MIGFVIVLALAVVAVVYFIGIYNSLVGLRESVKVAWANIDVLLKQRHDELPKLVDACKRHMFSAAQWLEFSADEKRDVNVDALEQPARPA